MEKLKNLLSPGKATDDEVMYGSGRSNDPVHSGNAGTLSGEGSHFDNSRDTPGGIGLGSSDVGNAPTTAGPHSSDLANKADPRVDSDLDGSRTAGNTTGVRGSTGQSTMPGAFESHSNPYSAQELDPRLGGSNTASGLGSNTTGAGYNTADRTGLTGQSTTGTTGSHVGRDAAAIGTAGAVGEGMHRRENERENLGTSGSGLGTNYGDNTGTGNRSSNTATGPHSSSLLNKLDSRVDSSNTGTLDNSRSGPHYGRDAAAVGGAAAVGEGIHHHRESERENLGTSGSGLGTNYGDNTGVGNRSSNTTTGPHSSSLLNKLDPRVDSSNTGTLDNSRSGPHYGRDAAAVGGAAAVGEGIHHHRQNERDDLDSSGYSGTTPSGTGSGYYSGPTGTAVSNVPGPHTTSTANRLDPAINTTGGRIENVHEHDPLTGGGGSAADSAHHLGRDAALGAGGGGLAEHEHRKHERERETGMGSTTGLGSGAYGDNSTYDSTTGNTSSGTSTGPHRSNLLNKLDPRVDSSNSRTMDNSGSDHHYGRDTAVGAGGVGLAEHEHRKHEREREMGGSSTTGVGSNTEAYGDNSAYDSTTGTSGHHYGRDAVVGAGGVGLAEHEHRKHERERETGVSSNTGIGSSTGAYRDDSNYTGTTGHSGHHYGRDAAVGAGGVGLAEHEHRKHERESALGGSTGTTAASASGTGPAPNTAGPHSQDWMNKLDPRVNANPDTADTGLSGTRGTTHGGRDAVAGAGLVGAAGYEAEKHHAARNEPGVRGAYDESTPNFHHTGRDASAVGAATGLDENEKARMRAARGERDSDYDQSTHEPGYGSTTTGTTHHQSRDHHLGRDAAGAGVVGGGLYEAEKHHKHDKDLTAAEREQKRELKHEEKEAKREQKEEKKSHGLLGFLHRDKNKKYTKEEEDEFDRQEREHNRHTGRDAAIGGAAVGGAAYEAEKHHGHHHTSSGEPDTMKPLPVAPGNHGIGTGEGTQNALVMDRKRGEGYDASSSTGAPGTTLGDKLHGVERNRGVNDGMTGAGYDTTTGTSGTGTHHLGRDAAVGAGGVGLAEHEQRKHEEERGTGIGGSYPTATGTTETSSGIGYGSGDPVTNMLGANTQAERSAGYSAPTAAKHNVLHKDPPPNHPAARAMAGEGTGGTYPQDTAGSGNY